MKNLQKSIFQDLKVSKIALVIIGLVVLGIILRVLPHAANVAPVGAIALFAGALLGRKAGIFAPLALMIVADLIIGLHSAVLFTWAGFALIGLFGYGLRNHNVIGRIGFGAIGSAMIFYVVSNFGVWITSGMYSRSLSGLVECYTLALPFLRASFMGDLAFATTFFGLYALLHKYLQGNVTLRLPQITFGKTLAKTKTRI